MGGIFASLIAPTIFPTVLEYPIGVALAMIVARRPERHGMPRWVSVIASVVLVVALGGMLVSPTQLLIMAAIVGVCTFVLWGPPGLIILLSVILVAGPSVLHSGNDIARDRSFFGVYTVVERDGVRELVSGTTVHGSQVIDQFDEPAATTYYHHAGPVGQVFDAAPRDSVGVVGLGAGSLAAYARPDDSYVFFEIDQLVVDIANDADFFSYLSSAESDVQIVVDDGRHGLSEWPSSFDVLLIDAFSSDAIPVHLLTKESMALYLDRLEPGGTLMIHISNRHFDLRPVVSRVAAEFGAAAYVQNFSPTTADAADGATGSLWMAIAPPGPSPAWTANPLFEQVDPSGPLWTDDYSNILAALDY